MKLTAKTSIPKKMRFQTPPLEGIKGEENPPIQSNPSKISTTLPTFLSSVMILMPCGCVGALVSMLFTTPSVISPVR